MSKRTRKRYDVCPPAESLASTLELLGVPKKSPGYVKLSDNGELERYRQQMWDDLSARALGNQSDLLPVWHHSVAAKEIVILLQRKIEELGGRVAKRQNYAAINIQAAAQQLEVALLLHTAADPWFSTSTISLCRVALELAAKGVFIFVGKDDEPGRWFSAHTIRDKQQRIATQISMSEALKALRPVLVARHAAAVSVDDVYKWLCGYVHFDAPTLTREPRHEKAFAAVAYVGWVVAVAAETVAGVPPFAKWPKRWPSRKPW